MNISKKSVTIIISLLLTISIVASTIILPNANATTPPRTWPTYSYLSVSPNPVGVGQPVYLIMWMDKAHPLAQGIYGDRFTGYTVNVTKPDGSSQILGPFTADAISTAFTTYVPDQTGSYTLTFKFPAQVIKEVNNPPAYQAYNHPDQINDTYAESYSNTVTLVVNNDLVPNWPDTPLPTDYWTRPINALNRGWAQVAGDWLNGAQNANSFNPYSTGPESAHVLWTRSLGLGGVTGDTNQDAFYLSTTASSGRPSPIILNGILYVEDRASVNRNWGWSAVDLYTGETLYYNTALPYPSFGSILHFETESAHGAWGYLWSTSGTTWMAIDPVTGNNIYNITNVPSTGTSVYNPDGALLRYAISGTGANKRLTMWNSTAASSQLSATGDPTRPYAYTGQYDGTKGYSLNVSIPDVAGSIFEVIENKWVVGGVAGKQNLTATELGHIWTLSLKVGEEGKLLSNVTFTPPKQSMDTSEYYYYAAYSGTPSSGRMQGPFMYSNYGVFVFWEGETRQFWGYSLATGQQIWGPTDPQDVWMFFGMDPTVAYGILYTSRYSAQSPGGEIHAYNITTGQSIWKYSPGAKTYETLFTNTPTAISAIADGKIYTISQEHSPKTPLRRDAKITCLDAFTGEVIWEMPNYMRAQLAISSGYVIASNLYDNQWYAYGKGPSATTVIASPKISVYGSSVLIEGTVTDQSPGAPGTPAIADKDQEAWMEYVYMQQPKPTNASGITVSLDTWDPNGNFVHIGDATSDSSGTFSFVYTPDVPGKYSIIASFAGSKSYGSSSATTVIGVSEASTITPTPTDVSQSIADTYFVPATLGIIVAIAIVVILQALLLLKKRP
jgi:hypothetical protein